MAKTGVTLAILAVIVRRDFAVLIGPVRSARLTRLVGVMPLVVRSVKVARFDPMNTDFGYLAQPRREAVDEEEGEV